MAKKHPGANLHLDAKIYPGASVAHEYVFQSKCYLKTADQGVHNFSEAKFADDSLTQFAFP